MSDHPLLIVEEGGEIHRLHVDSAVFGRSSSCDLRFDRQGVSRRHCEVVLHQEGALVRDLGSSHGTYLDGRRVQGESPIRKGQVIRLGSRGPRIRILDARAAGAGPPALDEDSRSPEDLRPRTQTAEGPRAHVAQGDGVPRTIVSAQPRKPADAPAASAAPAAAPRSTFGRDLALGLALGLAAGVVVLVLVDLSPLRNALGLS